MGDKVNELEDSKSKLKHLEKEIFEQHVELLKENSNLKLRNVLLTQCVKQMMENYKDTLSNKPVSNPEATFTFAESLLEQDELAFAESLSEQEE